MSVSPSHVHSIIRSYHRRGYSIEYFWDLTKKWDRVTDPAWISAVPYRVASAPWVCSLGEDDLYHLKECGKEILFPTPLPPSLADKEFSLYEKNGGTIEFSRDGQIWYPINRDSIVDFNLEYWHRGKEMPNSMYYEPLGAASISVKKKKEESLVPLPIQLTLDL